MQRKGRVVLSKGREVLMDLVGWADPAHTAVLVVDMQNDFCSPGGIVSRHADVSAMQPVIASIAQLLAGARRAGVPVIYIQHTAFADGSSESGPYMALLMHYSGGETYPEWLIDGTWGHEIVAGLAPAKGDVIVRKYRQPPWIGTPLDQILRSQGIRTIVVTGTETGACVDWTARLGVQLDYYVVVPEDCVGQVDAQAHESALATLRRYLPTGGVTSVARLLEVWAGA